MLYYNFEKIFQLRGINRPYSFLIEKGFSTRFASQVNNNKVTRLSSEHLEGLCLLLNCTPNDLMEWQPDGNVIETHPLYKLHASNSVNMIETLNSVPLDKMKEIDALIREKLKKE